MDAKRAVEEIRNNVSNYDLACELVGLLQRQEKMIQKVCEILDRTNPDGVRKWLEEVGE